MKALILILVIAGGMTSLTSCANNAVSALTPLNTEEKNDLLFLREEEKLAHDVYAYAYARYKQTIFNNIAQSEQNHSSAALNLLNKYGIADPAQGKAAGEFNNSTLQTLYTSLIVRVDSSLEQALAVGALIEDLDIRDIHLMQARSNNPDLLNVYDNLQCGSRNHLRSYVGQLHLLAKGYIPLYIPQSEFDSIISSAYEQCGR